jgi:hypothetical protein
MKTKTPALAEHYAHRLKRELSEANETIARLRDRLDSQPEIPLYATIADGHGCLHFRDNGNERNRSLSGCMDAVEILSRANGAPVFDISGLSIRDLLAVSDLPLADRVTALDSLFVPRLDRRAICQSL